jgi:hypothetical protein
MVLTPDDQEIVLLPRVQADVVVWVLGVPDQRVDDTAFRDGRRDHVGAIRRLLAMHRQTVDERCVRRGDD